MTRQTVTFSPETLAYKRKAAAKSWRFLLLILIPAAFVGAWIVAQVPVWQERNQRVAASEVMYKVQMAAELWGVDHPLPMPLDQYAPDYAALESEGLFLGTELNPYSGSVRKQVDITKPSPGDFTYLPLHGRVTRQDGSSFEAVLGYVLILWAKKELPTDLVIGTADWRAPVAMTMENGGGKWAPVDQEHYPKEVQRQTLDEALVEHGLKRLSEIPEG